LPEQTGQIVSCLRRKRLLRNKRKLNLLLVAHEIVSNGLRARETQGRDGKETEQLSLQLFLCPREIVGRIENWDFLQIGIMVLFLSVFIDRLFSGTNCLDAYVFVFIVNFI
jgi:hypothetical protein